MNEQPGKPTAEQIERELNSSDRGRLMIVREDHGQIDVTNAEPEVWDECRDDVEIIAVDAPLQGWTTGNIVWQYAVTIRRITGGEEVAFVGKEQDADPQPVTADDVRELLESTSMEPMLLRWTDTGEVEVVAGVLLSDISYVHYDRDHELIVSQADLRSSGDFDSSNPTDEDCQALADMLNDPS